MQHNLSYLEISAINLIILFELRNIHAIKGNFTEIHNVGKLTRHTEITNLKPRNIMNRFHTKILY